MGEVSKQLEETSFSAIKVKVDKGNGFESYMAKVLGQIVTEEKGKAERTKAISMPSIIINKAKYKMEP